jgi:hypothetical protein
MSDLEAQVSRLLDPTALDGRHLTDDERTLLATWATKAALTLNGAEAAERQIIAWEVARRFGQDCHPPNNVRVWIASYTGDDDQMCLHSQQAASTLMTGRMASVAAGCCCHHLRPWTVCVLGVRRRRPRGDGDHARS